MSFNFPASPALNALYPTPAVEGLPQYRWDGQKWVTTVGLAGTGAVLYDTAQSLTTGEKTQARTNIDAVDTAYVNAGDNGKVAKAGDTMTGTLTSRPSGIIAQAGSATSFFVESGAGVSNAALAFHVNGVFGANFGLANDGNFYMGGWSHGAVAYRFHTTRDFNYTPVNKAGDTMTGSLTVGGELQVNGSINANGSVFANSGSLYTVGTSGNVHLWFNDGPTNRAIIYWERATGHLQFSTPGGGHQMLANGRFQSYQGYVTRAGMSGGAQSNCFNISHTTGQQLWIDLTNMGTFYFPCDYRIKKDIKPLPSTWHAVKRLKPVSYTNKDFTPPAQMELQKSYGEEPFMKGDDIPRIGFLAHELQEELGDDAATSYKDAPDAIQSPNSLAMIAVLTKALQEAIARIEALEAR